MGFLKEEPIWADWLLQLHHVQEGAILVMWFSNPWLVGLKYGSVKGYMY